jgi:hypothetical protein
MTEYTFNPEIETAVLKEAAQYEPVASHQVVQAIADYSNYLEFDDNTQLIKSSVKRLVNALVQNEPNLFRNINISSKETDNFLGGAGGSSTQTSLEKKKKEALALLGIIKK